MFFSEKQNWVRWAWFYFTCLLRLTLCRRWWHWVKWPFIVERLECRLPACKHFCIDCLETRTPNILSSIYRVVIVKSHDQVCHWKKWNPYITLKLIFKLSETFKLRHNLQNLPAAVHSIANHDGRFPKQNSNLSVFDFDSILLSNVLL